MRKRQIIGFGAVLLAIGCLLVARSWARNEAGSEAEGGEFTAEVLVIKAKENGRSELVVMTHASTVTLWSRQFIVGDYMTYERGPGGSDLLSGKGNSKVWVAVEDISLMVSDQG